MNDFYRPLNSLHDFLVIYTTLFPEKYNGSSLGIAADDLRPRERARWRRGREIKQKGVKIGEAGGEAGKFTLEPLIALVKGDGRRIECCGMIVRLIKARLVAQGLSQYGLENEYDTDSYAPICVKLLFFGGGRGKWERLGESGIYRERLVILVDSLADLVILFTIHKCACPTVGHLNRKCELTIPIMEEKPLTHFHQ